MTSALDALRQLLTFVRATPAERRYPTVAADLARQRVARLRGLPTDRLWAERAHYASMTVLLATLPMQTPEELACKRSLETRVQEIDAEIERREGTS
jgi:hypothetical protein